MSQSHSISLPATRTGKSAGYRWILGLLMVLILAAGWFYPYLGFAVPVVMMAGMAGGAVRGRWVCGNLCPRGSFFDTWFGLAGFRRPIPKVLYKSPVRWSLFALLMGLMVFQLLQNPASAAHWGRVFWTMCAVTTLVGIGLGILFRGRAWCAVCPVGTVAASLGGSKALLVLDRNCRQCGLCERSCPMGHRIAEHRDEGILPHRDCLKCSACLEACPVSALSWPTHPRKAA